MGGLLYIWYSDDETERSRSPSRPLLAVPNLTAHPPTASVPITVLLDNGPLLCGFNVIIKRLNTPLSQKKLATARTHILLCGILLLYSNMER